MNMKNRLSGLKYAVWAVLAMGLALGARAENVAEVTIGGTTTQYADITAAWSACKDQNATLKLLKDVDITSTLNKNWNGDGDDLLLDLGGHTLKQTSVTERLIDVLGKLTVTNGVLTRSVEFSGSCAGISVNYYADDESVLTRLVMRGVTMTNCVATGHGGAIYAAKNTQVLLENCTLRQNAAGGSGGAIYTEGGATADGEPAKAPWDKLVLISTVITDNTAAESGAGVYYKYTVKGNSCFAAGTKVLLADGSVKVIEDVVEGEVVRTFDHEGGTNSTAEVCLTVKEPITTQIFVLTFADGYGVRCVLSHDFLMKDGDACKYVCLSRQNAADYVGKSFYAADGQWHELLSVTDGEMVDEVYEIYTSQHLNSYADGLLTVPADVACVLNIYDLSVDLKADAEQLAADVAAYGYLTIDEAMAKGMSRAYYDAFGAKYANVIVGKGLMTMAQVEALYRSTQKDAVSVQPKTATLPKLKAALPKLTGSNSDPLADYPASCLTLGAGTIVTNNLVGTKPNNIYLEKHNSYSLIALANDRAGICAGVTPQWTTGQITACYYANPGDVALFRSDDADYAVWYALGDDGSFLKIAAGSQIVPPAVANTTYEIRKDDEIIAWNEGTTVEKNSNVRVVYAADDGYVFDCSGATTKDVPVVTSTSVATMSAPDEPFYPVARSVKTDGGTSLTTYHAAITEAINAIGENGTGTVTMLADVTLMDEGSGTLPNGIDLVFDLAGKKIDWTSSKGDALFYFASGSTGKLTLGDSGVGGTITSSCTSDDVMDSALILFCDGNADLTVNGGTFVCSNKVGAATLFFKKGTGTWTFNDGTYKALGEGENGAHFLYCAAATGTTLITGGTYDIRATTSGASGIASNAECFDKITITGGDFDVVTAGAWGGAFSCGNGTLVVNGGDFSVTGSGEGIYCFLAEREGTTILSNGTFYAATTDGYAYAAGSVGTAALTIAGGTYSSKAKTKTAASIIGKEQSKVTLVDAPVINNGTTDGTAWCLAVQVFGAELDFTGYTGANLANFAAFADNTYGAPYVQGDMTKFNGASIFAGYFSTRPNDGWVQEGKLPLVNVDAVTKTAYPWVIGKGVAEAGSSRGNYYASFTNAWKAAADEEWSAQTNVFVRLLADVTVDAPLVHVHGKELTLDLNDNVLAYGGANNECVLKQEGGTAIHIVDTSTKRTARYFTCDESGLWTRTDHETNLVVRGGLITGGRASAVSSIYGGVSISNVNFVGNSSATSGGAVLVSKGSLAVAESAFFGNVSALNGGAIYAAVPCDMSNCRVEANVATNFGGGAYMKAHGSLVRTSVVGNKAGTGGGVYLTFAPSCFPAGVKILMADGSEKNVEEVVKGDVVATFDHVGGTNSSAAVFCVYRGTGQAATFRLTFASGATLDIADCHDLLFETTRKYVTVSSENARQFVGQRFYNYATGGWDELAGVTEAKGSDAHYSLYTRGHGNCVANGILTVPDDKDCFVNIYELDENLKADAEQLAADVVTYGVATTADYPNVPPDEFAAHNMRYARIAIGKGLTTQERILFWNEFDYGPIVEKETPPAPKLMMSAVTMPLTTTGQSVEIAAPSDPYLQVGEGTVVTGNVTTAGGTSNVYLMPGMGKTPVIDILPDTTDLDIGVTLSSHTGMFGWTNETDYASGFFSDDPQYEVFYTADRVLELAVAPHKHCLCGDGSCSVAGHSHEDVIWEPWTSTDALPSTAGNWYLVNDVTVGSKWTPADGTRLCLNGKTVTSTTAECAIAVEVGISFLITDCNTVPGRVLHADASGVNTYGVNVVGEENESLPTGRFTAYRIALANHPSGGIFSGPHAFAALYGVAVTNNDAQGLIASRVSTNFVFGGMIAGNRGYGIKADTATVVIEGALITGNASASNGGGINCQGSEMTLRDVMVIGNQAATHGGGVYVAPRQTGKMPWDVRQSVVTLDGATVITNNVVGEGSADNLYLEGDGSLISLAVDHAALDVGVTLSSGTGRFTTTDNVSEGDAALFTSDNPEYAVRFDASGSFLKLTYSGVQVGDDAWAKVADGLCTIRGAGNMWSSSEWPAGANPLAGVKTQIRSVSIEDGVTSIGDWAFQKFYALTNVTCASSVASVGVGAFSRCLGIETMTFAGEKPTLGEKSFTIRAGIRMEGGEPVVYPIPKVTYAGSEPTLYGKAALTDEQWKEVTDENKGDYHFFKYEVP